MRTWLLVTALSAVTLASAQADLAYATERTDVAVTNARAEIAAALYAASATRMAADRIADERFAQAQREIERLRGEGERARTQLIVAQEQYVRDLEERSSVYQEEIAVFRQTVNEIAETPQGRRALGLYAEGDPVAGREVLRRLMETRARAERRAADVRQAADARRIALLDLDALKRGSLDTLTVIADFELVTRLDPSQSSDWLELARLHSDAGRLPQAEEAVTRGLAVAQNAAERGRLHLERASILARKLDSTGAQAAGVEALRELTDAAASNPSVSIQRDLLAARLQAADETDASLLSAVRDAVSAAPNDMALQLTYIDVLLQLGEEQADRQDYRGALATLSQALDTIDLVGATDAERVAVDSARVRVLRLFAEIAEENDDVESAAWALTEQSSILRAAVEANPASARLRESEALLAVTLGVFLIENGYSATADDGSEVDMRIGMERGLSILRTEASSEQATPTSQLTYAGALFQAALELLAHDPADQRAQAMWDEAVQRVGNLARAYPDRVDIQLFTVGAGLRSVETLSAPAARRALLDELVPRAREIARRHENDRSAQNVYLVAVLEQAKLEHETQDVRAMERSEREAEQIVRQAARSTPTHAAGRLALANLYRGLGSHYLRRGDTPLALERYGQAFAIQRAVWLADPEITAFRDEFADDLMRLGYKLYETNDAANGARYYQNAIELFRSDVETGEDPRWRQTLLYGRLGTYSDLLMERRDWAAAQPIIEERVAILRGAPTASEALDQRLIAYGLGDLGYIARQLNDPARARVRFEEALTVAQPLAVAHPEEEADQRILATILRSLVELTYTNDPQAAFGYASSQLQTRRHLATLPNANAASELALADALLGAGFANLRVERVSEARALYDEAVITYRRVRTADPTSTAALGGLEEALTRAAGVRDPSTEVRERVALFQELLRVQQARPLTDESLYAQAMTHMSLAMAHERAQQSTEARASYRAFFAAFRQLLVRRPEEAELRQMLLNVMSRAENGDTLTAEDRAWLQQARAAAAAEVPAQ